MPGRTGWPGSPSTSSGRHAAGITPGELVAVAFRGGLHLRVQLGLQLIAVHQREYLEAEHERLD